MERFALDTPARLRAAPLLHADIAEDWPAWFAAAGIAGPPPAGPRLGDDSAIIQAALTGQGVALGRSLLVADALASGRLVAPFETALDASFSYWFVSPPDPDARLAGVRDWIVAEFRAS